MSCRISLLKAILTVLNTVLSLLGVGLIALSVYELNTSTPGTFERIAIVVQIFIGSFVILTSFLGCFGACRESLGLTWSYAFCIFMLLAFQIYIIITAHATDYAQNAADDFDILWKNHTLNNVQQIGEIEQNYVCCGRNGAQDYPLMGTSIPKSCYLDKDRVSEKFFLDGCLEKLKEHALKSGKTGLTIKWTLLIFELLALTVAAFLGITIRNKQRREVFEN